MLRDFLGSRAGVDPHGCAAILLRTTQQGVRLLGKNKVLASSFRGIVPTSECHAGTNKAAGF